MQHTNNPIFVNTAQNTFEISRSLSFFSYSLLLTCDADAATLSRS